MAWYYSIKVRKRQVAHFLLFLSGVGILIWQIWNTFQAFIEGQTTFATSREFHDFLQPPAIIFCPKNKWVGIYNQASNISDKGWKSQQFLILNDSLHLKMLRTIRAKNIYNFKRIRSNLTLGENFDNIGKTFYVEDVMNPFYGMCYALTPGKNYKMNSMDRVHIIASFSKTEKIIPYVDVYFTHPNDRLGFLLPDLGKLENKMRVELGNPVGFKVRKIIWSYLPSKRNVRKYEKENSYTRCIFKIQVDCYRKIGPKRGCNCVAENLFAKQFEFNPIKSWNACKTNSEYILINERCMSIIPSKINIQGTDAGYCLSNKIKRNFHGN